VQGPSQLRNGRHQLKSFVHILNAIIKLTEHLNNGDQAENLNESKPDKELLHGALLDGSIVEGGHLGIAEGLGDTREESNILYNHASGCEGTSFCFWS
jgi:hypothetical protein